MSIELPQRAPRLSSRSLVLAAVALLAALALVARAPAPVGASNAVSLQQRIAAAKADAGHMAAQAQSRGAALAGAVQRASAAAAREQQLSALLANGQARETRLGNQVVASKRRLRVARRRLRAARRALAQRLVAIYKSDAPDLTTVVLHADGFEDMLTRVRYWRQLNQSDISLAERVRLLRAERRRLLAVTRDSHARVAAHNRAVARARDQIAAVRARAEAEAAAAQAAYAAQVAAVNSLQSQVSGWVGEVQRVQQVSPERARQMVGKWVGNFAIPKSIVMCESGGNYRALNKSTGAGGAYQFTPETYRRLGGKYKRPHLAPKSEQDRLARKLWAGGRGRGNWGC